MKTKLTIIIILITINHCFAQIMDGYTDKFSYRAGDPVTFFTKHTGIINTSFDLEDLSGNLLVPPVTISGFSPDYQSGKPCSNSQPWSDGWGYAPTCTTWTPTNEPSGYYMLDGTIPIIIKGDNSNNPTTGADIVIVCPTNTINAYTDYSTAYSASSTCSQYSLYDVSNPTTVVSLLRPQNRARYGNCDDAFLDWIRTTPYKLNFISDADMDDYSEIANAKLLIIPGHSEYWTRQAKLNFDAFVDAGKNALILSGNSMWCQVRYQNDPNNPDNPQLVCFRGANWCTPPNGPGCFSPDPIASPSNPNYDPLLATYPWMSTDLKYSVLGSIGSDILRGGQSNFTYSGQKIINPNSPLLNVSGVPIPLPTTGGFPYIPNSFTNTEYDGTLVKSDADGNAVLVNGEPELDLAALGFYQGEIIGYEYGTPDALNAHQFDDPNPNNDNLHYFPFMVFKKTYTSGTIVNVNSNRWCEDDASGYGWTGSNPVRRKITENIINLMIADYDNSKHGELLFTNAGTNNPGQGFIEVKPAYTSVSYSACADGRIDFTAQGIYLDKAYKVDKGFTSNPDHSYQSGTDQTRYINSENNSTTAFIDASCPTYHLLRIAQTANNESNEKENIQDKDLNVVIFPNPVTSKFNIKIQSADNSEKNVYIFNSIYQEIYRKEKTQEQSIVIDLSSATKGIYFVKVVAGDRTGIKKIVLM